MSVYMYGSGSGSILRQALVNMFSCHITTKMFHVTCDLGFVKAYKSTRIHLSVYDIVASLTLRFLCEFDNSLKTYRVRRTIDQRTWQGKSVTLRGIQKYCISGYLLCAWVQSLKVINLEFSSSEIFCRCKI